MKNTSSRSHSRSNRGRGRTDSAGRHYTSESWERAQEGRTLGGEHSHGGQGFSYEDDENEGYQSPSSSRSSQRDEDNDRSYYGRDSSEYGDDNRGRNYRQSRSSGH